MSIFVVAKVTAKPKKITVRLNEPLKLRCFSDELVHTNSIKWFKNGHRLADEGHHQGKAGEENTHHHKQLNATNTLIEKKVINEQVFTSLYIRHAGMNDAGVYMCKFGHIHDKIFVDVIINDSGSGVKHKSSAEVRSNDETQPSQLDFLNSAGKAFAFYENKSIILLSTSVAFFFTFYFPKIV